MLINLWYVAEWSETVKDKPVRVKLLGRNFVLFRDTKGQVHCLADTCIHRGGALGRGWVTGDCVVCPYHGWRYDASGKCTVHVYGTTIRSHITPEIIEVEEGDTVSLHFTNLERAEDETHGFAMYGQNVNLSVEPGKTVSATFKADKAGVYPYYCTEFCSALHLEMAGYLLVEPN